MGKPFMRLDGKTGNFRGQSRFILLRAFAVASGVGLFFGLVGPYGSYLNGGLPFRTLYWITCSLAGFALYAGPIIFMRRAGLIGQGIRFWCVIAGMAALIGILQSWVARQLAEIMWPEKVDRLPGWGLWYIQVLLIALPAVMLTVLWLRHRERQSAPALLPLSRETQAPGQSSNALAEALLSPHPRPDSILALQMEDHYIRCHRQGGSILVHGTLRDAMARQSSCDGLQVHRSWWVARRALKRWEGTPRALRLHLTNGIVVPVARAQVARLREAGWLDTKDDTASVTSGCTASKGRSQVIPSVLAD